MSKPIILTGLRANSEFHIGNYMGAILPMVEMQQKHANDYQINMFVPDLHSFITPIDHSQLQKNIKNNLETFVAAGLDINHADTYIYRQSYIPAHSELTWILDCFTGFGELSRMTQFKDKSAGQKDEHINVGIFNYPVLMAADIILYGAEYVPVGEDQRQHLELTRDLAIRLNNKFERELFVVPHEWNKQLEFSGRESGVRIRSLRTPEKKMSKSIEDPAGTIMMSDSPDEAAKKIMGATTDSEGTIKFDMKERPGVGNLIQILSLLTSQPLQEAIADWEGKTSYGDLKKATADVVRNFMGDFQRRLAEVDEAAIDKKLADSEQAMNGVANKTLFEVQKAVGLR